MPTTASEQYLLELINDARMNPLGDAARYISSYSTLTSPQSDIQQALTYFGVSGSQLLAAFQSLTPVQPLAFSDVLAGGARTHDQAMIAAGSQLHQEAGEADFGTRLSSEGYAYTTAGENIYAYANDMLFAQAGFMVDWGGSAATGGMQSPAGHRTNIMSASFREVGVGVVDTTSTSVGPEVVTEDFGSRGTSGSFILGVAFTDSDNDGFYSIGEGRAGLVVSVGGSSTTSSASGGYTLSTSLTGTQTVQLSGGGLAGTVGVQMALTDATGAGLNAKIDVVNGTTVRLSNSAVVTGAAAALQLEGVQALTVSLGDGTGRTVLGNSGGDTLTGGSGNDVITGGTGNDTIDGGTGVNTLDGGGGDNTVVFDFASTAATVTASGTGFTVMGPGTTDTVTNFQHYRFTDGTLSTLPVSTTYAQVVGNAASLEAIISPYTLNLSSTPEKWAGPTLQALGFGGTALTSVQFSDGRLVFSTSDPAAQVYRMYLSAFGRVPDPGGQHSWDVQIEGGTSLTSMAAGFIGSAEFIARYGSGLSDTGFVTLLYQNVLGRAPDSGGLAGWLAALSGGQSRAQVLVSFSESAEHVASTAGAVQAGIWDLDENAAQVARLYDTVFGRIPDAGGLSTWSAAMRSGAQSLTAVAAAFVASAEFQASYGALSNSDFVSKLYVNALHRTADAGGLAGWVAQLNAGASRASVVVGFSESAEHQANTAANVLNPSLSQQGIMTSGPVVAAGAAIGAGLDQLQAGVASGAVTSLSTADAGVAAVPVTLGQLSTDGRALAFITGSYELDMHGSSSGAVGAAVQAAGLGTSTAAKYVQFSNGRLVFDTADRAAQVYRLYDSAFGRVADAGGEHSWSQAMAGGTTLTAVAQGFLGSAEFASHYGTGLTDTAFVTLLYQNVLHRAPDVSGLTGWLSSLSGGTSRAGVLVSFSESAEHIGNTAAAIHAGVFDVG